MEQQTFKEENAEVIDALEEARQEAKRNGKQEGEVLII